MQAGAPVMPTAVIAQLLSSHGTAAAKGHPVRCPFAAFRAGKVKVGQTPQRAHKRRGVCVFQRAPELLKHCGHSFRSGIICGCKGAPAFSRPLCTFQPCWGQPPLIQTCSSVITSFSNWRTVLQPRTASHSEQCRWYLIATCACSRGPSSANAIV